MDIKTSIILLSIFALYTICTQIIKTKKQDDKTISEPTISEYPYEKDFLLTKAEYAFYKALQPKCQEKNILICPKVRMEDFIKVTTKNDYMKYRGYIKSRHVDFLLCDINLHIIAGIELDDNSHNSEKAKSVDNFKDNVFKTIKLPLYRIKMSEGNYEQKIVKIIQDI